MAFFNTKKKTDSLRTLTEKEIQDKLYGSFRSDDPGGLPLEFSSDKKSAEGGLSKTAAQFTAPKSLEAEGPKTVATLPGFGGQTRAADTEKKTDPAKIAVWTEGERRTLAEFKREPASDSGRVNPRGVSQAQSRTLPAKPGISARSFEPSLKKIGSTASGIFLKGAAAVLEFVFQIFKIIDVRKPEVQRIGYWVLGFGGLFLLFSGVHYLNIQREEAMKVSRKKSAEVTAVQNPSDRETAEASAGTDAVRPAGEPDDSRGSAGPANAGDPDRTQAGAGTAAVQNPGAPYVIQVCTFVGRTDASRLRDTLEQGRMASFVKDLTRAGGRTYYAVFIGRFPSYREAEQKLNEFQATETGRAFADAFVRTLK